jgi:Mitochondrial small ribosomal subunit Rsm22
MFFTRDVFSFPEALSRPLEAALWPAGDPSLLARRGQALRSLWERLAKGRGQTVEGQTHYSFRREEAEAYAAYYLPANCLKPALVLEESFLLGLDPLPAGESRWLDLGTGPGTAFWGVAWWCASRGKKLQFTGWDQSPVFADLGRRLSQPNPFGFRADFQTAKGEPLQLLRKMAPTHLSFVNSIAEIYPDPEKRLGEVEKLLKALRELERADGQKRSLIVIEPGSRESSRELAALKDKLQANRAGHISLPCLDRRACGALADPKDWCHEEAACEFPDWLNRLGAEAGLRKEALLFSYVVLHPSEPASSPARLRIVSQRLERKGQVECRLCTAEGKRAVRVQRSKATSENEAFLQCARGELWLDAQIGEKGDLERYSLPKQHSSPPSLFS